MERQTTRLGRLAHCTSPHASAPVEQNPCTGAGEAITVNSVAVDVIGID
jgi:hypothetical protein